MEALKKYPEKLKVVKAGGILRQELIDAFVNGALLRWKVELINRIIPENLDIIRETVCLHDKETGNSVDDAAWKKISEMRQYLAKDGAQKSLFSRIKEVLEAGKYEEASKMQQEMAAKMGELTAAYAAYERNLI